MITVFTMILLVISGTIASYYDLRWRIIPNFVTIPTIILGICVHTFDCGMEGFYSSLIGIAIGSAIFLLLYIFGWMGAGDVKMAAAVGALIGGLQVAHMVVTIIMIGGILGVLFLLLKKEKNLTVNYYTVPYGVAIFLGAIISMIK